MVLYASDEHVFPLNMLGVLVSNKPNALIGTIECFYWCQLILNSQPIAKSQ